MTEIHIWKLLLHKARIYQAANQHGICSWLFLLWKTKCITASQYEMMKEKLIWYSKQILGITSQVGYYWNPAELNPRLVFICKIIKQNQTKCFTQ